MEKANRLCIIHGNCQGEVLAAFLAASPEFSAAWRVEFYVNFQRQAIPAESLAGCGLFLHQHLGERWGGLSSASLAARLPEGALRVRYPNMLFKGYWPFWSSKPGFEFADSLLDGFIERGLSAAEALHMTLRCDLDRLFGLGRMLGETLAVERAKELSSDVKYVHALESGFRSRQLFQTVNHPRAELMLLVADGVLGVLGLPPLPEDFRRTCPELYPEFELPIHPKVAAFHGLGFCPPGRRFNVFGQGLTYEEYAALYIDCRLSGRADFTAYLQGA